MKNNTFETEYRQELKIRAAYEAAKEAGDEEGRQAAVDAIHALQKTAAARGAAYNRIAHEYTESRDRENELLDFHDVIWERVVAALIACLRENGVERFTFSSTWSGAVETAWLFLQNGCRLDGMTQVNNQMNYFSGEYEKRAAYIFSLN